jgi:hypothetical protein
MAEGNGRKRLLNLQWPEVKREEGRVLGQPTPFRDMSQITYFL